MAARRREMYYTEGSVVRKREIYAEPSRERERESYPRKRQPVTYRRAAERAERTLSFNKGYTAVISLMLMVMVASCVVMLKLQSDVTTSERRILSLQNQLQTVQADNIAYENSLNNMYSIDEIYTVATGELGMVYSEKGQVLYYESAQDDYVTQYQDVPATSR